MNRGNRARIAALREREQYLGTVIEEKRSRGQKASGYMLEERNALRWAIQIAARWMAEDGEDAP